MKQKSEKPPKNRGKSSTSDILGGGNDGSPGVNGKWAEHLSLLADLRERFSGAKTSTSDSARQEVSSFGQHMADAATDSYDRDWALAMASSAQGVLYEIDQALKRIRDGSYGVCEVTGRPIEAGRLKAIPWTRYCAAAQAELESRGRGVKRQLGQLGSYGTMGDTDAEQTEDEDDTPLAQAA